MPSTRVIIEEIPSDSREMISSGRVLLRGRTLASLIEEFGGYEGDVEHPTSGNHFSVSLERWRGRDPDSTWLVISFVTDL